MRRPLRFRRNRQADTTIAATETVTPDEIPAADDALTTTVPDSTTDGTPAHDDVTSADGVAANITVDGSAKDGVPIDATPTTADGTGSSEPDVASGHVDATNLGDPDEPGEPPAEGDASRREGAATAEERLVTGNVMATDADPDRPDEPTADNAFGGDRWRQVATGGDRWRTAPDRPCHGC